MVRYDTSYFAKSIEELIVERFAADFERRLVKELQALGHVKRDKSTHGVRGIVSELFESQSEAA
jgi:hypothetical protein